MLDERLHDENELQSYFVKRIEAHLRARGRRIIGWDEILDGGLAPGATVQSWRGLDGAIAAARAGHDVIVSPTSHCYLDYAQWRGPGEPLRMGFIPLETVYAFEPTPEVLTPQQARHVLGAEGNMWTEHAPQARVDRQVFPRLCALAEVTWSPPETRDWADFNRRLWAHYRRLDQLGVDYFLAPPRCVSKNFVFENSVEVVLENPLDRGEVHYTIDGAEPSGESPAYSAPFTLTESATVKALTLVGDGRATDVGAWHFRARRPLEPVPVGDAVPGLELACYDGHWQRIPGFPGLTAVTKVIANTLGLEACERPGPFAAQFAGYLDVPRDGVYTFHLESDDGSRLMIGAETVVDHDGLHSRCEQSGQVILKAGKHPLALAYFDAGGARFLKLEYEGPGIARQPIPASALWHADRPMK
jgi:hexosaminidase